MNIHYTAILVASVLQFIFGAVWYTPVFGKVWGKIHGFDTFSSEEQKGMMKKMIPLLAVQFIVTILTTFIFALLIQGFPRDWNIYGLAGFFWIGFVVPTQVSAVLFGGTDPRWIVTKIAIMAGASFGCLMIVAGVLNYM